MPLQKILVASDRSETATRAVAWAAELAERYGAELVVLQVVPPDGPPPASYEAELAAYARETAGPRTRAKVTAAEDPAAGIVAAAEEERVDVVVVGNIGMSGRKEFLLGNVPNRVSHNARCTVVIVNTIETGGRRLPRRRR